MMAYIDEDGNIVDTPPDETNKEKIDASSIEISVPKKVDEEPSVRTGRVVFFDESKGYGFINEDGTQALCESLDQRSFIVDICMYSNWVVNLAHEMVHVKQFARGELDSGLTSWKSNKYCANIEYWDQPWEKEARRLQFKLAEEFEKSLDA